VPYILMEYCAKGSLWDRQEYREDDWEPYRESTLWRIFKCLIDGLTVLHDGAEMTSDPFSGRKISRPIST